ncbi:hypothetical protein D3C77_755450 [compost metagenome]
MFEMAVPAQQVHGLADAFARSLLAIEHLVREQMHSVRQQLQRRVGKLAAFQGHGEFTR